MSDNKLELNAIERDLKCCLTALSNIRRVVNEMSDYIEQNIDNTKQIIESIKSKE